MILVVLVAVVAGFVGGAIWIKNAPAAADPSGSGELAGTGNPPPVPATTSHPPKENP